MSVSLSGRQPDWYQLTYTSSDGAPGVAGGWGVKAVTPETPEAVVELLSRWASTRLVELEETWQFASDEALNARPRRLLAREVDGRLCVWHAVPAGVDASGRPGNVFNHAAALKRPDPQVRAIEYWRSRGWLTPFRVNDVASAKLGELPAGTAVTRESVIAFVRQGDRLFTLEWLVAAVVDCVDRGRQLVLATSGPDEAAMWLGALCFLTSPGLARRLPFVTFERAQTLDDLASQRIQIVCIPREDIEGALAGAGTGRLVLDLSWTIADPEEDGAWHHAGQSFPVARYWQNSVLDAFALDDAGLLRVLESLDEIAAGLAPEVLDTLDLHWPLSTALLSDPAAVVSSREELLEGILAKVHPEAIAAPTVAAIVEAELAQMSEEDRAKIASDEVWGPIFAERQAIEAMEAYLGGGWRSAVHAPPFAGRAAAAVGARLTGALAEARAVAASRDADLTLAAARLLTQVLVHVDGSEVDPDVTEVVAEVRAALTGLEVQPAQLGSLHNELWPESLVPPPPVAPTQPDDPALAEHLVPEPEPMASHPFAAPVVSAEPTTQVGLLEALWHSTHPEDVRRLETLQDALLIALGFRAVPVAGPVGQLHGELTMALEWYRAPAYSRGGERAVTGWLACYFALADAQRVTDPIPADLLDSFKADPDPVVQAVSRFVFEADDALVAQLLTRMLFVELHNSGQSLLRLGLIGQSFRLGRHVCMVAWRDMGSERQQHVMELAIPELDRLRSQFGVKLTTALQPFIDQVRETRSLKDASPAARQEGSRR